MKLLIYSIFLGSALLPSASNAEYAQRFFWSADNEEYGSACTPEAFFFLNRKNDGSMTLENNCHAQAADGREGSWCWSNGGFVVDLDDESINFPRQEIGCEGDIDMSWPDGGDGFESCRCSAVQYESSDGSAFEGYCTPQAYIIKDTEKSDVLTLDTNCTASLGDGSEGSWCHANGGFVAEIGGETFGFPRQSPQCNGTTEVEWIGGELSSDQCGC